MLWLQPSLHTALVQPGILTIHLPATPRKCVRIRRSSATAEVVHILPIWVQVSLELDYCTGNRLRHVHYRLRSMSTTCDVGCLSSLLSPQSLALRHASKSTGWPCRPGVVSASRLLVDFGAMTLHPATPCCGACVQDLPPIPDAHVDEGCLEAVRLVAAKALDQCDVLGEFSATLGDHEPVQCSNYFFSVWKHWYDRSLHNYLTHYQMI